MTIVMETWRSSGKITINENVIIGRCPISQNLRNNSALINEYHPVQIWHPSNLEGQVYLH